MYWNWKAGGVVLGITFLLAIALVKPIGVSTQFVILDGLIADSIMPTLVSEAPGGQGHESRNAYLNKSGGKYANAVANPLNYSFVFVLSMVAGGLLGRLMQSRHTSSPLQQVPRVHLDQFGQTPWRRYAMAFVGGVLVLWGARLAGGCTSGHMMSGMMQTAVSGYLFAIAAFAAAIPTAMLIYRKEA